jgi:hypothetical protein
MADENDDLQDDTPDGKVPAHRFREVVGLKNTYKGKVAEYEKELPTLREKATKAEQLEAELVKERAERAAESMSWGTEKAFIGAGILDDEDREAVLYHYNKLDPKDRPKPGDWIASLKKEPEKAPKRIRDLFAVTDEGDGDDEEVEEKPTKGKTPPKTRRDADANSAGGANGKPADAKQIREAREKAEKSKDPKDWEKFYKLTGREMPNRGAKK